MGDTPAVKRIQQKPSPLVGKYFLGVAPRGWMGYVRSAEADGYFYLDLCDWLMGAYSNSTLLHLRDMAGWAFFNDKDDLARAANLHMRRLEREGQG